MERVDTLLVDARAQVLDALRSMDCPVPFTLRREYPAGAPEGNVLLCREWANAATACPVVDRIAFQVEIYAADRESRDALSAGVNAALTGMGLRRQYAGADEWRDEGRGFWYKRFRFGRRVDKRSMRLID